MCLPAHPAACPTRYRNWDSALFSIAADTAKGMAFIHYHGLLHRDLKPGNVLIDAQWVAKIADFGNVVDDTSMVYQTEEVRGNSSAAQAVPPLSRACTHLALI